MPGLSSLLVTFLTLVMLIASQLLFREWFRTDREVKRLRRRVAELEQQHQASQPSLPAMPPAQPDQVQPYDTNADTLTS